MAGTYPVRGDDLEDTVTAPGDDRLPVFAGALRRPAEQLLAARGLFRGPAPQVPADLYAKVVRGDVDRGRRTLVLGPRATVSTNTYFGRFPASYWQRWTTVTEVQVELDCVGTGEITVHASDSFGDRGVVATEPVSCTAARTVRLVAPVDKFLDGGALWLELSAGERELRVERVRWTVSSPDLLTPTSIVVCTHNRVDDCLTTLAALAADPESLALVNRIHVVDQGSDPVESRPSGTPGGRLSSFCTFISSGSPPCAAHGPARTLWRIAIPRPFPALPAPP